MGRWKSSFSSEMFDRQRKKRCAIGVTTERIDEEQQQRSRNCSREDHNLGINTKYVEQQRLSTEHRQYQHQEQRGEKTSSSLTTMCDGSGGDVAVVAAPAEEWSPIREARPPPPPPPEPLYEAFDRFPPPEPGASSDMDTEEDAVPLRGETCDAAPAAFVARAADDSRASAADDDVGLSGGFAGGAATLNRTRSGGFMTANAGEPAPKRKRLPDLGTNPVVQVTYEGLTRESKNVLQQALQTWAYWHSRRYPSGMEPTEEASQSGTEAYSPALTLEPTSTISAVKVWMDKPLKKRIAKIEDTQDGGALESQDKEKDVPLYDRVCISALVSEDSPDPDGCTYMEPEEASRCFNCRSYSHSLRSCPRPLATAAIRHARDARKNKRGHRPRTVPRYYQCSPGGKFDDLKPGLLSLEAKKAIGIGELDPPPWLNRMREIGYPPGYLEDIEEESSGVEIIDDYTERLPGKESVKDGNVEHLTPVEERKTGQKMVADYPGINAPIPENADKNLWASPPEPQLAESPRGSKRSYHQISQIHNGGYGVLSPNSPATTSWGIGMGDTYLREESCVRNVSNGDLESYARIRSDGMESCIDVHGSNLYLTPSPLVNMNGNLIDPAHHWSKRRIIGTSSLAVEGMYGYNARSDSQAYHHIHSSPSGLASPIRGMFRTPSPVEHMSPPANFYSRHNYYHSGPQRSLPMGESPNQIANQAWLKAQSALDALKPSQTTGGPPASPPHLPLLGALQKSRGPVMAHHWGRR